HRLAIVGELSARLGRGRRIQRDQLAHARVLARRELGQARGRGRRRGGLGQRRVEIVGALGIGGGFFALRPGEEALAGGGPGGFERGAERPIARRFTQPRGGIDRIVLVGV